MRGMLPSFIYRQQFVPDSLDTLIDCSARGRIRPLMVSLSNHERTCPGNTTVGAFVYPPPGVVQLVRPSCIANGGEVDDT